MKEIFVLFVDDEENVLNSIKRLFADETYGIAVASNAEEAMAIIAQENIKVVLSDQRMPNVSGVQLLHRIKMQYPNIIRILFTAYADLTSAEQAINISEVFRFINKPWNPNDLKAAVVGAMYLYDVTMENRRLMEVMKSKNQELQVANCRLKVLYDVQKDFSSTLSHELRTPLAAIKAAIDIVMSGTAGGVTDEQKNFLDKAKDNVDRLNRLINNILDLAHMESGKAVLNFQSGDINKVIRKVAEAQEAVARNKGLSLQVNIEPQMPPVSFDGDKISQVLNNLIANAIKFTDKGSITVSTKHPKGSNYVEISIQDTGPGIKEDDLIKLFEKFQQLGQVHTKVAGTGLGLAISREIIRQHRGKIDVESKLGEWTRFYFILPIDEGRAV